jgi:Putative peptidoglycan binding domain
MTINKHNNLSIRMKGDGVKILQDNLMTLGFSISCKEIWYKEFGNSTQQAVLKFQQIFQLDESGSTDDRTAQEINDFLKRARNNEEQKRFEVVDESAAEQINDTYRKLQEIKDSNLSAYTPSGLPVLTGTVDDTKRTQILLALYGEVCNDFRMLTDVRFKLLGLVPTISIAVLISLLSQKPDEKLSPCSQMGISIFGLLITIGIAIYNKRNTELYKDLVLKGLRIEEELGIDTVQFRGRIKPVSSWVNHDISMKIIYHTAIVGWIIVMMAAIHRYIAVLPQTQNWPVAV